MKSFFGKKREGKGFTFQSIPSVYFSGGRDGDFVWMEKQPEHADTLFVFNDNERQFYEHQRQIGTTHRCSEGGGNAAIRPYECSSVPRATGIPTGNNGGYQSLSPETKQVIHDAIAHLDSLLATEAYDTVVYSWNQQTQTLGSGIFDVDRAVLDYIVEQIDSAANRH